MTEYAPQIVSKLTVIAPICLNKLFVFSDQCSQALMTHNDIKYCSELPVWVCNFIFSCYFALIVCNYFCFVSLWLLALVTFTFKRSVCFVFIFPCVSLIQMYQLLCPVEEIICGQRITTHLSPHHTKHTQIDNKNQLRKKLSDFPLISTIQNFQLRFNLNETLN